MIAFCKNCKHFKSEVKFHILKEKLLLSDRCTHKSNIETTINWDSYSYDFIEHPAYKNSKNNCKHFEPTMLYQFKRLIFKNSKDNH